MLAHAVLSAFPRFLFFLFLFFFLETSSSAGRWAMGFGKELRKQLRKWLMAADKPDSSTPCSETPESVRRDTCHSTALLQPRASHTVLQEQGDVPRDGQEGCIYKWHQHRQTYVDIGLSKCLHTEMCSYILGCYLGQRKQRVPGRLWHWNQAKCTARQCVNRYKDM